MKVGDSKGEGVGQQLSLIHAAYPRNVSKSDIKSIRTKDVKYGKIVLDYFLSFICPWCLSMFSFVFEQVAYL